MPDITSNGNSEGKTYSLGFFDTQICINSLAALPTDLDQSWGMTGCEIDGIDADNYVEFKILSTTNDTLLSWKWNKTSGKKKIDLSNYPQITSTQDIKIRIEITTYI